MIEMDHFNMLKKYKDYHPYLVSKLRISGKDEKYIDEILVGIKKFINFGMSN